MAVACCRGPACNNRIIYRESNAIGRRCSDAAIKIAAAFKTEATNRTALLIQHIARVRPFNSAQWPPAVSADYDLLTYDEHGMNGIFRRILAI